MITYQKSIPLKHTVDIFIAGGGPAGIAAAVSAAEEGKSVYLAESAGSFGGMGTTGLIPSFAAFTDGEHFLSGAFGRRIRDRLFTGGDIHQRFTPFSVEKLKQVYDEIALESGISFTFFTKVVDVIAKDGVIDCVILSAGSELFAVKAKIYIDCTGDGDVSAMAGAPFEMGEVMPATLCSLWSGIDYQRIDQPQNAHLEDAFREGIFTNEDRHLPGIQHTDPAHGIGGGNISHYYHVNPLDVSSLTDGMIKSRGYLREYETYYKRYIHGYENLYLTYSSDRLGIRESRRIVGDYQLTIADFRADNTFPDEIGRYCYPIDIHASAPDKEHFAAFQKEYTTMRLPGGQSYSIPYRILTPKGMRNLLVAGRCVSADRQMQASIRVMPGCFITGQAAGIAAAMACPSGDIRGFSVDALCRRIREKDEPFRKV